MITSLVRPLVVFSCAGESAKLAQVAVPLGQLPQEKESRIRSSGAFHGHLIACTPPAENSNPSGASVGADGQGACTPKRSNLDNTRRRAVVKGCKVRFPGGAIATVARVRLGEFWTTTGTVKPWPTEFVWVVA